MYDAVTEDHHRSHCYSPHLLDLLHFLQDVGSDDGHHDLESGQDGQDCDPNDLVVPLSLSIE